MVQQGLQVVGNIVLGATAPQYQNVFNQTYGIGSQVGVMLPYGRMQESEAVTNALKVSIPSIIVSAMGLFSATFGVALYSDVDIISSLCDLMARGAIVSMFAVILFLPAMFMLFDKMICVTSIGFRNKNAEPSNTLKERTA
jgi:hypothetical protein